MAIRIDGQNYYRTSEVCKAVGISKATFFRWLQEGILEDIKLRDRKGWRLFTEKDINRIKSEVTKVSCGEPSDKTLKGRDEGVPTR